LKSGFVLKTPVSHPPHPNSTGLFTRPTGRHYTKYRFSPDIVSKKASLAWDWDSDLKCRWQGYCAAGSYFLQ
jgi:hypothetical protein